MIVLSAVVAASMAGSAAPSAGMLSVSEIDSDTAVTAAAPATPGVPPAVTPPATPAPVTPAPATPADAATPPVITPPPPPVAPPASGEIVVSGERGIQKIDPFMGANKASYAVMQKADDVFVAPAMHVYRDVLPKPLRLGLHNFFYNLTEPVNVVNYILQLHPGMALKTVARFGINSTIGVAGLFDVAKKKPFNIHYRPNGFANTLGYYGVGPGPYFFLPFVGPTTLRDLVGTLVDQATVPILIKKPFNNKYYVAASSVITTLDYRVIIDDDLNKVRKSSSPYSSYRQIYLKTRFEEIEALHGRGPLAKGEVGEAPFAKPLYPDDTTAPLITPPPFAPGAAATVAPLPVAPPPMVFVSNPVVQPHPVVQPLPSDYRPYTRH